MTATPEPISVSPFGQLSDGRKTQLFTLTNAEGMRVCISDFGGVITQLWARDKQGELADVVLGFDDVAPYESQSPYFGALIGRFGNRIAKGRFVLDGRTIQLPVNDGENHLHGGFKGFDKVLWQAQAFVEAGDPVLSLRYLSPDGEEGYPGNLEVEAVYRLTADNKLLTEFTATTDAPTPVNLTQHSYFNLAGEGDVLRHQLRLRASHFTPAGNGLIPTGSIEPVQGTPFDFSRSKTIGQDINVDNAQLSVAGGYDHNFVLDKTRVGAFEVAAEAVEPETGRKLVICTTEPGIQFYSGNFLNGTLSGKGRTYAFRHGFCLEPQHYPDAPNQPAFPATLLRPGETYRSKMSFEFSVV